MSTLLDIDSLVNVKESPPVIIDKGGWLLKEDVIAPTTLPCSIYSIEVAAQCLLGALFIPCIETLFSIENSFRASFAELMSFSGIANFCVGE